MEVTQFEKWLDTLRLEELQLMNTYLHIYSKKLDKDPNLTFEAFYDEVQQGMKEHEKKKLSA